MTYEDKLILNILNEIKGKMRKCVNKKAKDKIYYELRVKEHKFDEIKFILLKLYQEGFKQGVYTAK